MADAAPTFRVSIEQIISLVDDDEDMDAIDRLSVLAYAKILNDNGLPVLLSNSYLANLVGYSEEFLYRASNASDLFYRSFNIKKANGANREISEPLPDLKIVQRAILSEIVNNIPIHKAAHAYRIGYSIKRNARLHLRQKFLLKMDICDFFPSISEMSVFKIFKSAGYTEPLAKLLSALTTVRGCLPQGAPTSAAISNIVMASFDEDIFSYARNNNLRYTRYADDIIISGDNISDSDIAFVRANIEERGFRVNDRKTKLFGPGAAKIVTGVAVDVRMRAPRQQRMNLRQEVHFVRTQGIQAHAERKGESAKACLQRIKGRASFMSWLDDSDEELKSYIRFLTEIQI